MGHSHRRCAVCGTANHACGTSDPSIVGVDEINEGSPTVGELKNYPVGGIDQGNGVPFPADTVLRLDDAHAEKMGLKKPSKSAGDDASEPKAKPAKPPATRKRPAPAKKAAGRKRSAPAKG